MNPSSSGSARPSTTGRTWARPAARRWPTRSPATPRRPGSSAPRTSRSWAPSRSAAPPTRRASSADVERASGVPLHVLSHEEEAYLTLVGVTSGQPVAHETLVVDIGGGSSEFCAVAAGGIARAPPACGWAPTGCSTRFVGDDPPTADELEAMAAAADEILRDALPAEPTDLVLVGGTASNLLKVTAAGADGPRRDPRARRRGARDADRSSPPPRPPSASGSTPPGRASCRPVP